MADEQPRCKRCSQDGCIGVRLPATAWCLAHAAEQAPDAFDAELKRIRAEGSVDARGVLEGTMTDPRFRGAAGLVGGDYNGSVIPDFQSTFRYANASLVA